jgi:hypothetical protein
VDVRDQPAYPLRRRVTPPEGAPNVLVVLVDAMGFGASGVLVTSSSAEGMSVSLTTTNEITFLPGTKPSVISTG